MESAFCSADCVGSAEALEDGVGWVGAGFRFFLGLMIFGFGGGGIARQKISGMLSCLLLTLKVEHNGVPYQKAPFALSDTYSLLPNKKQG